MQKNLRLVLKFTWYNLIAFDSPKKHNFRLNSPITLTSDESLS